jgi:lysophospholipase L1-like esterase
LLITGCSTVHTSTKQQTGESLVFIGDQPAALAWLPLSNRPITVRSTYLPSPDTIYYTEGRDYIVDYANGTLRRTSGSRLPDYRTNCLYGQTNFDHTKFPSFNNEKFFAFVDYSFAATNDWPHPNPQAQFLPHTRAKLLAGQKLKIVAFGDSITFGANVSEPEYIFWNRWVAALRQKYPHAEITIINGATGGDTTVQGLQRLQSKVLDQHPDLVLIGFGMNDHNVGSVPIPAFEQNLKTMIARIRETTGAEVILYSAFPPNPLWKFGSHHMADYAATTRAVAAETSCAYADVFDNWEMMAARKKPEDLLANDINHPSDFGHWIYFQAFEALGL